MKTVKVVGIAGLFYTIIQSFHLLLLHHIHIEGILTVQEFFLRRVRGRMYLAGTRSGYFWKDEERQSGALQGLNRDVDVFQPSRFLRICIGDDDIPRSTTRPKIDVVSLYPVDPELNIEGVIDVSDPALLLEFES